MMNCRNRNMAYLIGLCLGLWGLGGCAADRASDSGMISASGGADPKSIGGEANGEDDQSPEIEAGQLTAGEWSDIENWSFWTDLMSGNGENAQWSSYWEIETLQRIPVSVMNGDVPVIDARVRLVSGDDILWENRTDNHGAAELFVPYGETAAQTMRVVVTADGVTAEATDISPEEAETVKIALDAASPERVLDLMFVIDATGSMGDELAYLTTELESVIDRVAASQDEAIDIRISVNMYRDEGDSYVVRSNPFTTDVDEARDILRAQSADGGGDFPEAVEQALYDAVFNHQWSEQATARLCFLVLDAPPHHDAQVLDTLQSAVEGAAEQGIRIIPVSSSGVDASTEFLLRSIAIVTGSTYTFLTDDSGIGNDHLEPTIGQYEVEYLNDLLVRLIKERINS